jgi:NAD(P)-dependent dehydrogenase (short-subunit alcohol dehydrogenase family)
MAIDLFDLSGRAAFVTGGASGIGLAIVEAMLEHGAAVTAADRDEAALAALAERLGAEPGSRLRTATVDVTDRAGLDAAVDAAVSAYGRLDAMFVNAGVTAGPSFSSPEGRLTAITQERWDASMAVNLGGAFATMQAAARHMIRQGGGRIVVTTSVSGLRTSRVSGYAYGAAKAGLVNLVRQAALELGPHGINVNGIAPGFILTNIAGGRLKRDQALAAEMVRLVPLGRLGQPADLKGLAVFLAAPASAYVTGTVVPIDGGFAAT